MIPRGDSNHTWSTYKYQWELVNMRKNYKMFKKFLSVPDLNPKRYWKVFVQLIWAVLSKNHSEISSTQKWLITESRTSIEDKKFERNKGPKHLCVDRMSYKKQVLVRTKKSNHYIETKFFKECKVKYLSVTLTECWTSSNIVYISGSFVFQLLASVSSILSESNVISSKYKNEK